MAKERVELKVSDNDKTLLGELEEIRGKMQALKKAEDEVKRVIFEAYGSQIKDAYAKKGDGFGSVTFYSGGAKVILDVPKKVEWEQKGLKALYEDGAPVSVEYNVPEAVFKAQDDEGKAAFMPYRTVTPGTMSIKIERE